MSDDLIEIEQTCEHCGSVLRNGWQHTQLCRSPEERARVVPVVDPRDTQLARLKAALLEACDLYRKAMDLEGTWADESRISTLRRIAEDE